MVQAEIERLASQGSNIAIPITVEEEAKFWRLFKCQRCGQCCIGASFPSLKLESDEVETLARFCGLSKKQFKKCHTHTKAGMRYMPEPCLFYEDKKCSVYYSRPVVCRLYPLQGSIKGRLVVSSKCPASLAIAQRLWNELGETDNAQIVASNTQTAESLLGSEG